MSANHDIRETPANTDPGRVVAAFASKDAARLTPFPHPDVEFAPLH